MKKKVKEITISIQAVDENFDTNYFLNLFVQFIREKAPNKFFVEELIYSDRVFEREILPTLSEDERVILRNIDVIYNYIGRDDRGYLYIARNNKNDFSGRGMNLAVYNVFGHLFQFIKERRRI